MMSRGQRERGATGQYNMMSEQRFQQRLPERSSSPNLSCNSEEWITATIHIPEIKELSFLPTAICPRSQNAHRAARAGTDLSSVTWTPNRPSTVSRLRAWVRGRMKQDSGGQGQISQGQILGPGESPALSPLAGLPEADPPPLFMAQPYPAVSIREQMLT